MIIKAEKEFRKYIKRINIIFLNKKEQKIAKEIFLNEIFLPDNSRKTESNEIEAGIVYLECVYAADVAQTNRYF